MANIVQSTGNTSALWEEYCADNENLSVHDHDHIRIVLDLDAKQLKDLTSDQKSLSADHVEEYEFLLNLEDSIIHQSEQQDVVIAEQRYNARVMKTLLSLNPDVDSAAVESAIRNQK